MRTTGRSSRPSRPPQSSDPKRTSSAKSSTAFSPLHSSKTMPALQSRQNEPPVDRARPFKVIWEREHREAHKFLGDLEKLSRVAQRRRPAEVAGLYFPTNMVICHGARLFNPQTSQKLFSRTVGNTESTYAMNSRPRLRTGNGIRGRCSSTRACARREDDQF